MLRPFTDVDRTPLAEMDTHPLVVETMGSSPSRVESDALADRYVDEMALEGWGRWAVGVKGGEPFVGMVGLRRVDAALPGAGGVEVGWRLHPDHWGHGYATEAATASLGFGFDESGLAEIVAFTATVNTRSQAVMERIGMVRDLDADFDHPGLPEDSPLRRHVVYRAVASHPRPTVAVER